MTSGECEDDEFVCPTCGSESESEEALGEHTTAEHDGD
jgi:uncharacterized membrane protein YvbJ